MLNHHIRLTISALLTVLLVTGCVSTGNVAMKEQNQQTIEQTIIKGKTNKQEIFGRFGSADSISFMIVVMKFGHTAILAPNRWQEILSLIISFLLGETIQTKELVILFDSKGIVSNYTFRETANQSKAGLAE